MFVHYSLLGALPSLGDHSRNTKHDIKSKMTHFEKRASEPAYGKEKCLFADEQEYTPIINSK